jgi:hypothetical protein
MSSEHRGLLRAVTASAPSDPLSPLPSTDRYPRTFADAAIRSWRSFILGLPPLDPSDPWVVYERFQWADEAEGLRAALTGGSRGTRS